MALNGGAEEDHLEVATPAKGDENAKKPSKTPKKSFKDAVVATVFTNRI
eukprot:CAMPEP_0114576174 /NCGR_PEP_ID=MMETSP0125-20121206/963_1 /TAXON_ID=485358 ORGANISM="Aristerostoma sp., Strain ATCC 50986" /NCGR_SAMPLE_ID=MMETSP0125 /ASSEMBLY_ACC=CAM_ASM_000245 /LENGTH=48 /DNA_ID= /DNA_START= /DNA_END= /DNA_ORIENTATION=